ncbi:sigma-70 RNA polymerase sigma factor region 4 domain-containing protein [[Kitasatospora] papulosa]|uniref:hypothetical protein n=1 Tax=[Kitasatospora] papulosa TaxID=1464011 RepID=UPI0036A3C26E
MNYREADRKLYKYLEQRGFRGPEQETLETRLLEYSWPLLMSWVVTGEIYRRTKDLGRPVPMNADVSQALQNDHAARSDLVSDMLMTALPLFRSALKDGKWDSERGSLTTYFIGSALLSFPNVYRRWAYRRSTQARESSVGITPEDLEPFEEGRVEDQVGTSVGDREAAQHFFLMLKSPDREVAQMVYNDVPISEIAVRFKVTPDAIRRRLRRMKNTAAAAGFA